MKSLKIPKVLIRICTSTRDNTMSNINTIDTQHPCFPSSLRNSHIRLLPLIQGFLIFILCFKLFLYIRKILSIFGDRIYFDNIIHVYLNCQTRSYTNLVFRCFNKARHRQGSAFSKFAYLFNFFIFEEVNISPKFLCFL